jgi:HEAT repeat protein
MDLLELGIAAVRAGNKSEARMYLEAVTMTDPNNAQAFLWLSFVLEDRKLAMRCLERVLELEPENEQAKKGLTWLRLQSGDKSAPLPPHLSDAEFSQLVQLLKHPQERIIVKAVRYLGQAGGARAVQPLMNLLMSTKSKTVQSEARTALIAVGTPSIDPALQRLMNEANTEIANQLAAILARVRSMAALTACREVAEQARHPAARYAIVLNLTASVHGEAAIGVVRDYVLDPKQDPRARTAILTAVGQAIKGRVMDADQGVSLLMEVQNEQFVPVPVRQAALIALGISSQPAAARYLSMAVSDSDPQMRVTAVDALARFTPPQVALLDRLARSAEPVVRTRANQILGQLQAALKQKR